MDRPYLSFLVSTYDAADYLDRRLHNLLEEQEEKNIEVIVVNPNSPGADGVVAEKWASQDERVKYIFHPERETYGNSWLRAWNAARGEFVCNANTDDLCYPSFTTKMWDAIHFQVIRNPKIGFFYSGLDTIDETGKIVARGVKPPFNKEVMSRECWGGPCVAWSNRVSFREEVDWDLMHSRATEYNSAFDYWLWLYFMSLGYEGFSVPEILIAYTQRSDSIENSNKSANNYETYSAISEFYPHNFDGHLKHAKEFRDFENRPPRDQWVELNQRGKKWRRK
jgi:glycosyltransferase involved in cell wall biosynthesis